MGRLNAMWPSLGVAGVVAASLALGAATARPAADGGSDPVVTTRDLGGMWRAASVAATAVANTIAASFVGGRR